MIRLVCGFLALFAMATAAVRAADNVERAIIGFSSDGRYFAFEQYGVQDGSGFPFSEIFIVDLDANQWVKGSPLRAKVENDGAPVSAARAKSAKAAQALFKELKTTEPGEVLASQAPTQSSGDRHRLSFDPFYSSLPSQPAGRFTLSLELLPFTAPENCYAEDGRQMGFKLIITDKDHNTSAEIHKDLAIPASRICPRDYDVADVIAYRSASSTGARNVALIGVYMPGFEGLNRRLIAVPFTLP
jgi:predicted secreted protein